MKLRAFPPVPTVAVAAWSESGSIAWANNFTRAAVLVERAGSGRHFTALVGDARTLLDAGDLDALATRLTDRRFVRAVATAWAEDDDLAARTLRLPVIGMIDDAGVSRLGTLLLARIYLDRFDGLDRWQPGLHAGVRTLVRKAVASHPARTHVDAMESLRRQDSYLFTADGPARLAAHLVASHRDLTAWFKDSLLSAYSTTRFARVARDEFYLAQVAAADAEQGDHEFLGVITDEVLGRQRTATTEEDGWYFGHRVLLALTDKRTRRPSAVWIQAMLDIGGDPRFQQTESWLTWWERVPEENLKRAVRWMSGINLTAFLDGVEAYAKVQGNVPMQRMLERRKRLLNGLYEQDRIDDVRLVMGSDVSRWIRRSVNVDLGDAARLDGSGLDSTAVIYVNCGDFCLVEGSHNFSLHVYIGGPLEQLENRARTVFHGGFLRDELPGSHLSRRGSRAYTSIAHHASGSWIVKALDFLKGSGVTLDERGLMTKSDFADLSRRRVLAWRPWR